MTLAVDQTFKKNPGFVSRRIAGELILIPVAKELRNVNSIYSMNSLGAEIWDLLDTKNSIREVRDEISSHYDVTEKQLDGDLQEIFDQLQEIKAIQTL